MRLFNLFILVVLLLSCNTGDLCMESIMTSSLERVDIQIEDAIKANRIPRSLDSNYNHRWAQENWDWTEGFFPGICWLSYEHTRDTRYKEAAEHFQNMFKAHRHFDFSHDLGFVFHTSYGKAYEQTGNSEYLDVLIEAGNTLITRFNPQVGCLQSWNVEGEVEGSWLQKRGWEFPVIIDNMMNLEMLFELTRITGDSSYYNIAVIHANTTLEHHFRDDFSSYHVINYNKTTGDVISKETAQGYSDESAWSRGQAWGLYGFTVAYRYTKDVRYLELAENIANYLLNHPQLPEDMIPYWDFDAPKIPDEPRDVSAAAITASALIELDAYSDDNYQGSIQKLLTSLSSNEYMMAANEKSGFILKKSVGSIPHKADVGMPLIYADYYFMEAVLRSTKKNTNPSNLVASAN